LEFLFLVFEEKRTSGRYSADAEPEARLQLLVNYLGPLVQTYPAELSEDREKIKRKREGTLLQKMRIVYTREFDQKPLTSVHCVHAALVNVAKKAKPDFGLLR